MVKRMWQSLAGRGEENKMTSAHEKLARKLLPNQSIRSDQKKASSHQRRLPGSSSLPEPNKVEIDWFDCSKNTEKKNEDCLETLFEIIGSPLSVTKSKTRRVSKAEPEGNIQDPLSSNRKSTVGSSTGVIRLIEKNPVNYLKFKGNPNFLLGINSTLKYLENLRFILIQLTALLDKWHHACNQQEDGESEPRHDEMKNGELILEPTNDQISDILRDLQIIKFIIVFKHHQHLSIIGLLSTFVNEVNQALYDLNFHQQKTWKFIELVGFPLDLNPPLLDKFHVRRLSCFAILDSAPGIERLRDFFEA